MDKKYNLVSCNRQGRPRSKRLRDLGVGEYSGGSSVIINQSSAGGAIPVETHTHENKKDLDKISTDEDGYEYLTRTIETVDEETNEVTVNTVKEKVKAGYADESAYAEVANDLTEDSPVNNRFLSKVKDDRTAHKVSSDKGFEVGEYVAGASGGMLGIDAEGESFAEVGRLWVRVKAFFEELTVIKAGVIAGKNYIAPGGGIKCVSVEETAGAWRCWFLSEQDGEKTECKFIVNDQAISEMFNAKAGTANKVSNHRYWRLVTAVNNDARTDDNGNHYGYIDLSKTDCETGSDTPHAGDEICQLGYRGTDNPQRQTAMVFSTVDADAPSVKLFSGINSYSLAGKAVVSFGRDPNTGQVFFRLGTSGAKQYLEYTQSGGLTVAGTISSKSTWDDDSGEDRTLGEVINDRVVDEDWLFVLHGSRTDAPALPVLGEGGSITDYRGWATDAPAQQAGQYIWSTLYVLKGDGTASFSDPVCIQGPQGEPAVSQTSETVEYAVSAQGNTPPTTGWQTASPDVAKGQYRWKRVTTTYSDGNSTVSYSVDYIPLDGATGATGAAGSDYTNNLLLNSAFIDGFDNWGGNRNFSFLDDTHTFEGRHSVKLHVAGVSNNPYHGISQYVPAAPGEAFTASVWAYAENLSAIDNGAAVEIAALNSDKNSITALKNTSIKPTKANEWQQGVVVNAVMPANTAYVQVLVWLRSNGTLWVSSPKLERGVNTSPQWTPASSELAVGIKDKSVTYAKTVTDVQPADSAFTASNIGDLNLASGEYMWVKTEVTYTDGAVTKSYAVSRIGTDGEDAKTGLHLAYASGISGSLPNPTAVTGFSTTMFAGARYIGVNNDPAEPDSPDHTDYEWALFQGPGYSNNLLVGTKDWSGSTRKPSGGGTVTADEYMGLKVFVTGSTLWRTNYWKADIEAGKEYTMSAYAYCTSQNLALALNQSNWGVGFTSEAVTIDRHVTPALNSWQRVWFTFRCTKSGTCIVAFENSSADPVKLAGCKLEEGVNPTPQWSLAAEEMVGTPAQVVVVNADAQVFSYENDFATLLSPQKITLSASVQGISNPTYQWSYRQAGQTGFTDITDSYGKLATLEVNPDGVCMGSARSSTVRCTVNGTVHDEVTIARVSSGSNGGGFKVGDRTGYNTAYTLAKLTGYASQKSDYWAVANPGDFAVGDTMVLNFTISDLGNVPCQFFAEVTGFKSANELNTKNQRFIYGKPGSSFANNLFEGTKYFMGFNKRGGWAVETELRNGNAVRSRTAKWEGMYKSFPVKAGETYTFSADVKGTGKTVANLYLSNPVVTEPVNAEYPDGANVHTLTEGVWKRISLIFKAKADGYVYPRVESSEDTGKLYVSSYKMEQGANPSPTWFPAVSEMEVAFPENLLLESGVPVTTTDYPTKIYQLSEAPSHGDECTLTLWGELSPSGPSDYAWYAYNSGGHKQLCKLEKVADGVYSAQFKWKNYDNTPDEAYAVKTPVTVNIYAYPSSSLSNTINRIKLERGYNDNPVWTPSSADGDSYTVLLTNESHIFEGDTQKAKAGHTDCGVIVYKGNKRVAATIGPITGTIAGKLTVTDIVPPTATAQGSFRVNVTTSLTAAEKEAGTLTVPVTVDGKTFTKVFSWALSLEGNGIASVTEEYALSDSRDTAPTGGWQTSRPDRQPGKYLWTRLHLVYTNGQHSYQQAVCNAGDDGLGYGANLLEGAGVQLGPNTTYQLGAYGYAVAPVPGKTYTLTLCYKVGATGTRLKVFADSRGYYAIRNFTSKVETVESFKFTCPSPTSSSSPVLDMLSVYHDNNDNYTAGTGSYVKWAVLAEGDSPAKAWVPSASEDTTGPNELRNSTFANGQQHWAMTSMARVVSDPDIVEGTGGVNAAVWEVSGTASRGWRGISQGTFAQRTAEDAGTEADPNLPNTDVTIPTRRGEWWTASVYTMCKNRNSLLDPGNSIAIGNRAQCEIQFYNKYGKRLKTDVYSIVPDKNGEWQRFHLTTVAPEGAAYVGVYHWLLADGTLYMAKPMLSRGYKFGSYAVSTLDTDYLAQALQNDSKTIGGVTLASLIRLGYKAENGEYVTMSGINGIYQETAPGGGIAFWGGGPMVDLAEYYYWDSTANEWKPRTSSTPPLCAKSVDRMDGSGYRAGGNLWWDEAGNTTFVGAINAVGTFGGLFRKRKTVLTSSNYEQCTKPVKINGVESTTIREFAWGAVGQYVEIQSLPSVKTFYLPNDVSLVGETVIIVNKWTQEVGVSGFIALPSLSPNVSPQSFAIPAGYCAAYTAKLKINSDNGLGMVVWELHANMVPIPPDWSLLEPPA